MDVVSLDGSYLEGGGQILRTALSLSVITGKPFELEKIRAGRSNPGLQLQHLACVNAAAKISDSKTTRAILGSTRLSFAPGEVACGNYSFEIGSAGSANLVLQTVLPPLFLAGGESSVRVTGGTSNPFAPPGLFVQHVFAPELARRGFAFDFELKQYGYFPKGGGVVEARIFNAVPKPLSQLKRGKLESFKAYSVVAGLPVDIAERMKAAALRDLAELGLSKTKVECVSVPSTGTGAEFFAVADYGNCVNGFWALGEKAKPAHKVAGEAVHVFKEFDSSSACFEEHVSDQLLLYAALTKGVSTYSVSRVSRHLLTNAFVIKQFLPDCQITIDGKEGEPGEVTVDSTGF